MRDFFSFIRHMFDSLVFLRAIFLVLALALLGCAVCIAAFEDMELGDAVYFTLITGFTIGYGDIAPTNWAGRLFSILAGFIGLVTIGLVVAVATRALGLAAEEKRRKSGTDRPDGNA